MSMNSIEIPRYVTESGLQDFIENMVEEIVLEDKAFDEYKDELERRCEEEELTTTIWNATLRISSRT